MALSESRNNGGLRFRRREAKPYLFASRRSERARLRACTGQRSGKRWTIDNARNCVLRKGPLSCVSSLVPRFILSASFEERRGTLFHHDGVNFRSSDSRSKIIARTSGFRKGTMYLILLFLFQPMASYLLFVLAVPNVILREMANVTWNEISTRESLLRQINHPVNIRLDKPY